MTDKQALAFMQKVDANAPFWVELHDEDRPTMNINGNVAKSKSQSNEIICIHTWSMWTSRGLLRYHSSVLQDT